MGRILTETVPMRDGVKLFTTIHFPEGEGPFAQQNESSARDAGPFMQGPESPARCVEGPAAQGARGGEGPALREKREKGPQNI